MHIQIIIWSPETYMDLFTIILEYFLQIHDMHPQNPPRQLESLTFYNKLVYYTEYFPVNFITVQGTTF